MTKLLFVLAILLMGSVSEAKRTVEVLGPGLSGHFFAAEGAYNHMPRRFSNGGWMVTTPGLGIAVHFDDVAVGAWSGKNCFDKDAIFGVALKTYQVNEDLNWYWGGLLYYRNTPSAKYETVDGLITIGNSQVGLAPAVGGSWHPIKIGDDRFGVNLIVQPVAFTMLLSWKFGN